MAWPVSRPTVRAQVRKLSDIENETGRHTDAEVNKYIQDAIAELWDKITEKNKDYRLSSYDQAITAGIAAYDLNFSCYKVRAVLLDSGSGYSVRLQPFLLQDIDHQSSNGLSVNEQLKYRSVGSQLFFDKLPQADGSVRVYYTPVAPQYSGDVDTIDFINGWDKYVVFKAAGDVDAIDGRPSADFKYAQAERQLARIMNAANTRDTGEPERILRRDFNIPWYVRTR